MCVQEGRDPEDEDTPDVVMYLLMEHYTMNLSQYARKILHSTDKHTGRRKVVVEQVVRIFTSVSTCHCAWLHAFVPSAVTA
jgi:hypothetical protein